MKKILVVAVASACALTGCAMNGEKEGGLKVRCDDTPVVVTVDAGFIGVRKDPIIVTGKNKSLCWQLDASAAATYRFTPDSISIDDQNGEFADCTPRNKGGNLQDGTLIACRDDNNQSGPGNKPRKYKYKITLQPRNPATPVPDPYDPWIVNN
jgi:hypothetical protein